MTSQLIVRSLQQTDEAVYRTLWRGYLDFYRVSVEPHVTDVLWSRLMDAHMPVHAVVAVADERVLGFANYILHPYTWGTEPICYLEDLFVSEDARGRGAGYALIQHLVSLSRENGWSRLYWHTHETNSTARALYERFVPVDPFVRYLIRPLETQAE